MFQDTSALRTVLMTLEAIGNRVASHECVRGLDIQDAISLVRSELARIESNIEPPVER